MTITLDSVDTRVDPVDEEFFRQTSPDDAGGTWWSSLEAQAPSGPLRLGRWLCTDADRPSTRLGPQTFQATLALGERIETATVTASGPVAALTAMLHEHGFAVEMLKFRQLQTGDSTATFIHGTDGRQAAWAMGCSRDPIQSALSAFIACANRLYAGNR